MPYILGHFIQQKQSIILKRGQRIYGVTIFSQSKTYFMQNMWTEE